MSSTPGTPAQAPSLLRHVCVIGAGAMGRGIAQVALQAGHRVTLVDPDAAQLEAAVADVSTRLVKRFPDVADSLDARLTTATAVDGAQADPDTVVVEAVVEKLAVKHQVFADALVHFGPGCVLATNTSSLSVTTIASGSDAPHRVVGMHFFNPVPAMRLVEVVRGLDTPQELADEIADLARAWGKEVAHVRSAPGFIVNRVARPFYGESLRLLEEGVATHDVIDEVLRRAGGFRMGPFELMDLIGNDVNSTVTRTVWEAFSYDPRFTPSQLQTELVSARRFGRKTGRGFYDYAGSDAAEHGDVATVEPREAPAAIRLMGRDDALEALLGRAGVDLAPAHAPEADVPAHVLIGDLGALLLTRGRTAAAEAQLLGRPVVVLDRCLDPAAVTLLAAAGADDDLLAVVAGLLARAGVGLVACADAPGLILARVVAMLVNEGWDAAHVGIAEPADIDTAMRLGTNYPAGPFAWSRSWGDVVVLGLLDALADEYRDPRYRPSQALRASARAQVTKPV